MTTLHLLGLFHTVTSQRFSHCAFTGLVHRFPKMMQAQGFRVVEYGNEGSESDAQEKVPLLSAKRFAALFPDRDGLDEKFAILGSPAHREFEAALIPALKDRVKPGDIICHPFGETHSRLIAEFAQNAHVETGIGYPQPAKGTFKIYPSHAWRHYCAGRAGKWCDRYEWVIPHYFDTDEWQPSTEPGQYIAMMGRVIGPKGVDLVASLARHTRQRIVVCGKGKIEDRWRHPNIEFRGPISGAARSDFLRRASCVIMPTEFIEPFGCTGVEALLCGTPLVTSDFGAFAETADNGMNGFRCISLNEWALAVNELVRQLDRSRIAKAAREKYSLEACGFLYRRAFAQIAQVWPSVRRARKPGVDLEKCASEGCCEPEAESEQIRTDSPDQSFPIEPCKSPSSQTLACL